MDGTSQITPPAAKRLTGKVAIITGGSSGLGKSTARLFAQHGAVVIIADIQDDDGESLCQEIASNGGNASYVHCDVTSDADMKAAVDLAVSKYGKLDIMFNNAGIGGGMDTTVLGTENETFKRVFDVNLYGGFLGAKHAARVMIPAKRGVILFMSSVTSLVAGDGPHAYVASKHAVVGLMKSLCTELGQHGIRVNAVAPSTVATPLVTGLLKMDKSVLDGVIHESSVLKGVVIQPEDVAEAALYLASDEAKYVTGLNLVVDGGKLKEQQKEGMKISCIKKNPKAGRASSKDEQIERLPQKIGSAIERPAFCTDCGFLCWIWCFSQAKPASGGVCSAEKSIAFLAFQN